VFFILFYFILKQYWKQLCKRGYDYHLGRVDELKWQLLKNV